MWNLLSWVLLTKLVFVSRHQQVKVNSILQQTISRPVYLPIGDHWLIFLSLNIFKQLRVYWCGEPSLMRGLVCSLQLLLASCLASAVFLGVQVPQESGPYFTISNLRIPQTGLPGHRIYIYPGTVWPSYALRNWVWRQVKVNLITLFLGEIHTGTWPSMLRESQIWDSNMWRVVRGSDPRKPAMAWPSSNC
jgi:hypothetical protein